MFNKVSGKSLRLNTNQGKRHVSTLKRKISILLLMCNTTIHAIGVVCAGAEAGNQYVPEMEALVHRRVEPNGLERLDIVVVCKQEQFYAGGICGIQREVDALRPGCGPQRMGRTSLNREGGT